MNWFEDEKPKRRKIDKNTKDAVWIKYMGNKAEGKCYCCKIRTIHITDFQVGHNKAIAKGGKDNISNLRPICGPCNRGMGTISIEKYRKKYFDDKTTKQNEKPISKKKLLNGLSKTNLKKVAKKLDIETDSFFEPEKEDYINALSSSRKVTVDKINEILNDNTKLSKVKTSGNKKMLTKNEKPISKKKLLNDLSKAKLKKIAKKFNLNQIHFLNLIEKIT